MLFEFNLSTGKENMYDVTEEVCEAIDKSGVESGICTIYCPHTTAGITINENADPDVIHDMLIGLGKAFPKRDEFLHQEGNSHAHLKSSCVGCNQTVIIENSQPLLGIWQGIYFCEFDGPRNRKFYVKVVG